MQATVNMMPRRLGDATYMEPMLFLLAFQGEQERQYSGSCLLGVFGGSWALDRRSAWPDKKHRIGGPFRLNMRKFWTRTMALFSGQ